VRRVLTHQPTRTSDKLISLFGSQAEILQGREVAYGHKLNPTTGRSGLILDLVTEAGNPADSERLLPMLEGHRPKFAAFATWPSTRGGGLSIEDMVRSR